MRQEILAINKDIQVVTAIADVRDAKSVTALWETVKEKFGKADVLVNNAGTLNAGTVADVNPDEWWSDFVSSPVRGRKTGGEGEMKT